VKFSEFIEASRDLSEEGIVEGRRVLFEELDLAVDVGVVDRMCAKEVSALPKEVIS